MGLLSNDFAYDDKDVERFWTHVKVVGACWLWTSGTYPDGYGKFKVKGRTVRAHRFIYMVKHGVIPSEVQVLHYCDQPLCVRDEHHFIGSHDDNMKDKTAKMRHVFGERHVNNKLTAGQVNLIRAGHMEGKSQGALAAEYGVSQRLVWNIVHNKTWKHI
jgi:hypothetical protein